MKDFLLVAAAHGGIAAAVFLLTSLTASYFLFNANHGTPAEWRKLLKLLSVELQKDRVAVSQTEAKVLAPLADLECDNMQDFINYHRIVMKVERRLATFKRPSLFFGLSFIFGIAVGFVVAGPMLDGADPLTKSHPWLSSLLGAIGTGAFVILGSLPHVHWWNALKEATSN